MNTLEIKANDGGYPTRAFGFTIADDLYTFFKFESPKSKCEIGVAFDQLVDAGDWYVSDGKLDGSDYEIVNDVVFDKLPDTSEFSGFCKVVGNAVRKFNGMEN